MWHGVAKNTCKGVYGEGVPVGLIKETGLFLGGPFSIGFREYYPLTFAMWAIKSSTLLE